tara:strand:- start:119 stop:361 length:243 start_codon:yes stop_codon:yes gene_type:complete
MDIKQEFREEKDMDVYSTNVNDGSFSNVYVKWLEAKLTLTDVSHRRELLIAFHKWQQKMWTNPNSEITENVVDVYLKSNL